MVRKLLPLAHPAYDLNLQLRVTNVHIRFEDTPPLEGAAPESAGEAAAGAGSKAGSGKAGGGVSVGVMLSEISAHTVDEAGRRAFVTQDVLQCLRKVRGCAGWGGATERVCDAGLPAQGKGVGGAVCGSGLGDLAVPLPLVPAPPEPSVP